MEVEMKFYQQQGHVSRSANATIPVVHGDFTQLVANFQFVQKGSGGYVPPTNTEKIIFRSALTSLLKGKVSKAQKSLSPIEIEIVYFTDTTGITFYLIREKLDITPRGWGLYAINPNSTRNIILEIPHPVADSETESEGASFFLGLSARALLISSTHRCANTQSSPCSGTTNACNDLSLQEEPYRISDAAHSKKQLFQVAHEVLLDSNPTLVAVALHGFSQSGSDPYAFVSDGTKDVGSATNLANQFASLLIATTGLANAAQSCNDGSIGARLCGTEDIQGRYANGSPNPCLSDALTATGRFLHIEQSLDFRTVGGAVESTQVFTVLSQLF
jgi:hypothetical protein